MKLSIDQQCPFSYQLSVYLNIGKYKSKRRVSACTPENISPVSGFPRSCSVVVVVVANTTGSFPGSSVSREEGIQHSRRVARLALYIFR